MKSGEVWIFVHRCAFREKGVAFRKVVARIFFNFLKQDAEDAEFPTS